MRATRNRWIGFLFAGACMAAVPAGLPRAHAQGFGPDPYQPYNSQYQQYVYPILPEFGGAAAARSPQGARRDSIPAVGRRTRGCRTRPNRPIRRSRIVVLEGANRPRARQAGSTEPASGARSRESAGFDHAEVPGVFLRGKPQKAGPSAARRRGQRARRESPGRQPPRNDCRRRRERRWARARPGRRPRRKQASGHRRPGPPVVGLATLSRGATTTMTKGPSRLRLPYAGSPAHHRAEAPDAPATCSTALADTTTPAAKPPRPPGGTPRIEGGLSLRPWMMMSDPAADSTTPEPPPAASRNQWLVDGGFSFHTMNTRKDTQRP